MRKVLHRSPKIGLPDHTTINSLTNTYGKYFADKIAKLRSGLLSTDVSPRSQVPAKKVVALWTMSEEEILKIIKSIPNKSYYLDPIPTSLVLDCISVLDWLLLQIF